MNHNLSHPLLLIIECIITFITIITLLSLVHTIYAFVTTICFVPDPSLQPYNTILIYIQYKAIALIFSDFN